MADNPTSIPVPQPGDVLEIRATVIEAAGKTGNHWLDNLKLAAVVEGVEGVNFGDMRLTVTEHGPWFTKGMHKGLAKLRGETTDEDAPAPESNGSPLDTSDIDQMTNRQLKDFAAANGIELPKPIPNRNELRAFLKDEVSQREGEAENAADEAEASAPEPETAAA